MAQRLEWLDFARGVSILLVVMFHASIVLGDHGPVSEVYWFANNLFSPIRMPVFFLVSGFLARSLIQRRWQDVLSGRVALLGYLFAVWTLIHFGVETLVPFGRNPPLANLLVAFYEPSTVLWFIWALAFYVLLATAGLATSRGLLMAASVLASVAVQSGYVAFDSYVYANVFEFLPFFLFGAWYSSSVIGADLFRSRPYVLASLALYVLLFTALYEGLVPSSLEGPLSFVLAMLGVNLGICMSIVACRFAGLARVPLYLGRNTLAVYVAHYPIVQLLSVPFSLAGDVLWLERLWAVPLVTLSAIALSLLLKVVADRLGAGWLYALPAPAGQPAPAVRRQDG